MEITKQLESIQKKFTTQILTMNTAGVGKNKELYF